MQICISRPSGRVAIRRFLFEREVVFMIHAVPIISDMLKFISKVFPLALRAYYTSARLERLVKVDISASGDGATFQHCDQSATCWLAFTNLSPFDFTIDRIEVEVALDAGSFSCSNIIPQTLKAASDQRIYVHGRCPVTLEAARFAKEKSTRARVGVRAYIVSSIRPFVINRYIEDVKNFRIYA